MGRWRARSGFGRTVSGGVAAVVAVPVALVLAHGRGLPGQRIELAGGGAWLASPAQGLVTLIDGAAVQVIGSVRAPGAQAGDDLSVLPAGSSAYLVNGTRGTVSRVDGARYEAGSPVQFGSPGGGLTVLTGGPALYVVDADRRVASVTDPVTLAVRQRLSLAAQPGPDQSVVDAAGRLWVIDAGGRGLTWFAGGKRVRPDVGGARTRLTLVQGRPVLVDPEQGRLGELSDDGSVQAWSCLDVRAADEVQLLGSAVAPRVYAAVSATGTLVAARLGGDECDLALDVGRRGDRFGPLVESGRFVFVPNRSSGRIAVVDAAAGNVAAAPQVAKPGNRLELLAKDGLIFYNDRDSDVAGVLRFDGRSWQRAGSLSKYDPAKPGEDVLTGTGTGDRPPPDRPPARPEPGGSTKPAADPRADPPSGSATAPPPAAPPTGPQAPANPPAPPAPRPPAGPPPPARPPQISRIVVSPPAPSIGQEVTFTATEAVAGAQGRWVWEITTTAGGPVAGPQTGAPQQAFTHTFAAAGRYRVRLTVSYPGGASQATVDVTVTDACRLTATQAAAVDLRTADTAAAGVSWVDCFGPQSAPPTTALAPWLRVTGTTTTPNGPGSGSMVIQLAIDGTPPDSDSVPDAITFSLGNGGTVHYDVLIKAPPQFVAGSLRCVRSAALIVIVSFGYADPADLQATITFNGTTQAMAPTPGQPSPNDARQFEQFADLDQPDPSYQVTATDPYGRRSAPVNGSFADCTG